MWQGSLLDFVAETGTYATTSYHVYIQCCLEHVFLALCLALFSCLLPLRPCSDLFPCFVMLRPCSSYLLRFGTYVLVLQPFYILATFYYAFCLIPCVPFAPFLCKCSYFVVWLVLMFLRTRYIGISFACVE